MVLIFLTWIYILFTTINFGFAFQKLLKLNVNNGIITSILGLFSITVGTSFWAIFGRINYEFHLVLFVLNIFFLLLYKKEIVAVYKGFFLEIKNLEKHLKIMLGIISIFIIAQCSSIPFIIDNESYYIQTIKWINEYGLVKGLGNLHLFLAQTSGWHITQSAFSFSFLYDSFNDLSGFCLLLGNVFAIQKLNEYFKTGAKSFLIIGLFPLANVLLFQFISSPSPDLPIYVFSFVIFSFFLENQSKINTQTFTVITVIVLFCLYIKTTAIGLCLFPVIILMQNIKKINIIKISMVSLIILTLFIVKNTIISGHPFFPIIKDFDGVVLDYKIPENMAKLYYNTTKAFAFYVTEDQFEMMSFSELFLRWITLPKLHGLFNKTTLFIVLLMPLVVYKFFNEKRYWMLYAVMLSQFIILLLSSPQYRFFLNFILLASFLILTLLIKTRKYIFLFNYTALLITGIILFIPLNFSALTKNKHTLSSSDFSFQNIIFPYQNSKYKTDFKEVKDGNLKYYSPKNIDFFWGTGDGPLPSVKEEYIHYFETNYNVKPQMRTTAIKNGFCAKDISKDKK